MPDAPGLELILSDINAETPGAVLDTSFDREQAALTGWAQANGLRGDTSIAERTKYDL